MKCKYWFQSAFISQARTNAYTQREPSETVITASHFLVVVRLLGCSGSLTSQAIVAVGGEPKLECEAEGDCVMVPPSIIIRISNCTSIMFWKISVILVSL